jgi:hypothetical protein
MRALVTVVVLGGCVVAGLGGCLGGGLGAGSSGATRPGVMPMLSELPADPTHRDAVLDSSAVVAGPEQRKGMTGKERKAETAAATAAAILGGMFSKTKQVTIGTATQFDENELIAPDAVPPPRRPLPAARDRAGKATANTADPTNPDASPTDDTSASNTDLIPWIKLR